MFKHYDTLAVLQWAKANGALSVKVGDVEVLFPSPDMLAQAAPTTTVEYSSGDRGSIFEDPDYRGSDMAEDVWATRRPMKRGQ